MHLVSVREHTVELLGERFHFRAGERIHTENSYKYSIEQFSELALRRRLAGQSLLDRRPLLFAVFELR